MQRHLNLTRLRGNLGRTLRCRTPEFNKVAQRSADRQGGGRMGSKRLFTGLYYIAAAAVIIYVMICSITGSDAGMSYDGENKAEMTLITPSKQETDSESEQTFLFQVSDFKQQDDCLLFYTSHQFVKAYADDKLIYSVEAGNPLLDRTPGSEWNFVNIPENTQQIRVVLTAAYPEVEGIVPDFLEGVKGDVFGQILLQSLPAMEISLLNTLIGVAIALYWMVIRKKTNVGNRMIYFATTAILVGFWTLKETDGAALLVHNHAAASASAFCALMLISVPFTLYSRDSFLKEDKYIWKGICTYSLLNIVVCFAFQLSGILDFRQTVHLTHLALIASMCYMIYGIIRELVEKGLTRRVVSNLFGMSLLAAAMTADLIRYNANGALHIDTYGKAAFTVYIILIAYEVLGDSINQINEGHNAVYYRQLATVDAMTGLYNRMAFMQDVETLKKEKIYSIISFDLNELKKVNDTMGHLSGDQYIRDAAVILKKVFSKHGRCYRIGGDEFCVILKNGTEGEKDQLIQRLEKEQALYNRRRHPFNMRIAYGSSDFVPEQDGDYESVLTRADAGMYEKKQKMKSEEKNTD